MDKKKFIEICNFKLKLVRTESSFSQEKMALILGISKKTLVEIEKGRSSLGWTGSVALCSIFSGSDVIAGVFGGNPSDTIIKLAFEGSDPQYPQVIGGNIWWQTIKENKFHSIQQNIISQHYRLLDSENKRIASSFNIEDLMDLFNNKGLQDQ